MQLNQSKINAPQRHRHSLRYAESDIHKSNNRKYKTEKMIYTLPGITKDQDLFIGTFDVIF